MCSKTGEASKRWRDRNKVHIAKARESGLNIIKCVSESKHKLLGVLRSKLGNSQAEQFERIEVLTLAASGGECEQMWSCAKQAEFLVLNYIQLVDIVCGLK